MIRHIPTSDIDISHHVQRRILLQLRQNGPRTYAQLKPDGLEGNAYNYHLRELKKAKLVAQSNETYQLTNMGHLVSDAFSFATARLMLRPHHYIAPLVTHNDKVLVYIPTREPMAGRYCLPSGKLHYGESIEEAIQREMERRNLTNNYSFTDLCALNVRYVREGEVVVHRPGTIWHITYDGECAERQTESGITTWLPHEEVLESERSLPEVVEALKNLRNGTRSYIDLTFSL